jgi:hypothetical protein
MLHETIATEKFSESSFEEVASLAPEDPFHKFPPHTPAEPVKLLDQFPEQTAPFRQPHMEQAIEHHETGQKEAAGSARGHALFQEMFFFCTIKKVGDLSGSGSIYVETVVDRDSGLAFAKIYPAKNAGNAVDILASRVVPFFERHGLRIKEIHTRKTSEYCGLIPVHPFESFLTASHIQHRSIAQFGEPCNYLCEEFYRLLLREYFPAALRQNFRLCLDELQKGLDTFVEAFNAAHFETRSS